ncbi:Uncharacterised protein [Salmonella enterica subsp. enterica serovar Bovismorbificans]|uniref:Uncharacterized protein n=1 Tax=Salmonella enterica subsp. enterica serovar Bovismorbificans TaxID=58097 RepID=A0A655BPH6_SALET|nr:Uncharacterised protein [Salmonella enterica subsp. enterica serovar Bovismorbificans]CPR43923.1 Uncharacterised protein [Salmonella enterica subsp. enterica serovar Bovismorbificans]CPR63907.1 Uncharacterised protein [Salmonella enterica subsp. enterica serovar Bovismorbificans]
MAQRRTGKARPLLRTWIRNQERRLAHRQSIVFFKRDFVGQLGDFSQQFLDFRRFSAVIQRGNQLNRFGQFLKVSPELGFHICVEHSSSLSENIIMQADFAGLH